MLGIVWIVSLVFWFILSHVLHDLTLEPDDDWEHQNMQIFIYKAAEITRNDDIPPKLHGNWDERINQRLKLLSI